jgi:predicted dehydrogenase
MTTDKLRVGIIGAGFYATVAHIPSLRATGRAEVAAIARRNPDRLALIQRELDIPEGYTDWREMLDKSRLDAVVIATPHNLHVEPALAALDCGLHVLVEKPATDTIEGARALVEAWRKTDRVFTVAEDVRGMRSWRTIKGILDAGHIGAVRQIHAMCAIDLRSGLTLKDVSESMREWLTSSPVLEALAVDFFAPNVWRSNRIQMGGDSFNDVGIHLVDLMLWLGGAPAKCISAFRAEGDDKPSTMLSITAQLTNGVLLSITYNDKVASELFNGYGQITAYGSAGYLSADWQGLMKAEASTAHLESRGVKQEVAFEGESVIPVAAFVSSILDGAPNFCTIEDGLHAVELVQSAYRAAETKQVVTVPAMP